MKIDEILNVIKALAKGNGFYGRLLSHIQNLPKDEYEIFVKHIEHQNFSGTVDLILFFEQ